jgi:hypothetical protein
MNEEVSSVGYLKFHLGSIITEQISGDESLWKKTYRETDHKLRWFFVVVVPPELILQEKSLANHKI